MSAADTWWPVTGSRRWATSKMVTASESDMRGLMTREFQLDAGQTTLENQVR